MEGQADTEPLHSTTDTRFAVTRLGGRVVVQSMAQSGLPICKHLVRTFNIVYRKVWRPVLLWFRHLLVH